MARGYQEAITYSFVDPKLQAELDPEYEPVGLANPLSPEMSVMRTTLWTGLLKSLIYNLNRQQDRIRLFETGLRFRQAPNQQELQLENITQEKMLAGVVCGNRFAENWADKPQAIDFYDSHYQHFLTDDQHNGGDESTSDNDSVINFDEEDDNSSDDFISQDDDDDIIFDNDTSSDDSSSNYSNSDDDIIFDEDVGVHRAQEPGRDACGGLVWALAEMGSGRAVHVDVRKRVAVPHQEQQFARVHQRELLAAGAADSPLQLGRDLALVREGSA